MVHPLPSQDLLQWFLEYDPDTGVFTWKAGTSNGKREAGDVAGTRRAFGYIYIGINGQQLAAHRLAWVYVYGVDPGDMEIDHIDGNPSNNAIANLRLATSSQQKRNKSVQRNNRYGLKGAYYHACRRGKKWRSQIKVGNVLHFLGYFHTAEEAHAAYREASLRMEGEFSYFARDERKSA